MNFKILLYRNLRHFIRYYRLAAVAVMITVGVIVGSLLIGDSVRTTLTKRVKERLGNTETVLFSRNSFLSDSILLTPLWKESVKGLLLTEGFISRQGKLLPVLVWGIDDPRLAKGSAKINTALAEELDSGNSEPIVIRLPATGLVPSGSLFVTENYTTSLRLASGGILTAAEGGNMNLKNEQIQPFNIFVNRSELAEALKIEGKINLILADRLVSAIEWERIWNYSRSGLKVCRKDGFTEITSDRIFLQEQVVEAICRDNRPSNRVFSYLANTIERKGASIPYSFVTAMDRYKERKLGKDEILLSDYAARRLKAGIGDTIRMSYYTSKGLKALDTAAVRLRVAQIVPLSEWVEDGSLSTDFPGLSDAKRCTDWESDLPIRMERITDEDEHYWDLYRNTPKAIIAYDAVAGDWGNTYGNATAVRVMHPEPNLTNLQADMFGIQLIYPRDAGLYAARNGVDFSGLFLALGFFIIVSALLLMLNPLSKMLYQRRNEIDLLRSLGYTRKRITGIVWAESVPVVVVSAVIGVATGLLYTGLIMWLLGSVWKGATQTDGFRIYPEWQTILIGTLVSLLLSLGLLYGAILYALNERPDERFRNSSSLGKKAIQVVSISMITGGLILANFLFVHSVILFMATGVLWIVMAALWGDYWVSSKRKVDVASSMNAGRLIGGTLYAGRKQSLLSFYALASGVFIVFSVGLNRKDFADSSQIRTGTGGYSLWAESHVPIYYDLTTRAGKDKLSLRDLPDTLEILQCLRYRADDASCLNLNKVSTPTVLGVDMKALSESDFRIEQNVYEEKEHSVFERLCEHTDSVYPALVDATVLTWGIGLNLGDTLRYEGDRGQAVGIRLVGTLSNSVFQGNILVDRSSFSDIWRETVGSEVFLLKALESEKEEIATLFSQALHEYGVRVWSTHERLKQFNSVTDTYLTIFMTLGGLGLLLGIIGFIIAIRKNLVMRDDEIRLYSLFGFEGRAIERILYKENIVVPIYAIITGSTGALISIGLNFPPAGQGVWLLAFCFLLFFVGCIIVFVDKMVRKEVSQVGSLKTK